MARNDDNKMSREEAGRMGGETTSKNHDKDFYQEIGQKGGEARGNNGNNGNGGNSGGDGKMSREEAGRKGGEARARQRDRD
ncbi:MULTISPECIES: KGG domain-containing protein [unclassified Paenibacillus]|uniref:KGG domain-containing protein n=1 Tax=unclassified Paenibacillus TaxID=185978 RepID=UPI00020D7A06|nr:MULTISPECIES: KGG domain-containing protein [unclassified Paenibacillus]EGL19153.1 glucose starvation-inducible protein B [Paenibacillus sp. HGF7]EPD81207.1 hypothetical protein HMPREF1207_04964 [Paenibacillus sp. HGH0039]